MPITRAQFEQLNKAPSIVEEITIVLKGNTNKAFSFEEIHQFIFGESQRSVDMIFARVALMILNEREVIEVKQMHEMVYGKKLYFAWKNKVPDQL